MLKNRVKEAASTLLERLGLRVTVDRPYRDTAYLMAVKSHELGIGTLLDVGANRGQFAQEIRARGFSGAIVSFDPLSHSHVQLSAATLDDGNWTAAPRMALGSMAATSQINVSMNSVSSSFLEIGSRTVKAAPASVFHRQESVEVKRLDDVTDPSWRRPFAMKVDTQGFEMEVLRGAPETLRDVKLLAIELSLAPLYEGGPSLIEVYDHLEKAGLRCIAITPGFADIEKNELLQVDGVFVRD